MATVTTEGQIVITLQPESPHARLVVEMRGFAVVLAPGEPQQAALWHLIRKRLAGAVRIPPVEYRLHEVAVTQAPPSDPPS